MFASLRSRLALTNLLVTLLALLALTLVFTQLLREKSLDVARAEVNASATQLTREVNAGLLSALSCGKHAKGSTVVSCPPQPLWDRLLHDSKVLGKRIIWFDPTGRCVFDSSYWNRVNASGGTACGQYDYGRWLLSQPNSHRAASDFIRGGDHTFLVTQRPLVAVCSIGICGLRGAVVLLTDASSVTPTWSTLVPVFLVAALAAAVAFVLITLYFAYAVSRPLVKVTEASRAMARGHFNQRVDIRGGGEIAELAESFNHMATEVAASHQLLKDFVANVSHDLRTPLTIISGYAGTLLDGTSQTPEETHEAAGEIAQEAGRMQRLVDDLLQLTRLESGLRRFDQRPFAVRALVQDSIRRTTTASNGRHVDNLVPEDLPLARADPELVERVLVNLLNNAIEHTPSDGKVTVSANPGPGWIQISVADTGTGISPEDQARIFERFYRTDKGRRRDSGHAGLGLPIVKEIVEAHGGELGLESAPGKGSTFRFTIPRAPQEA